MNEKPNVKFKKYGFLSYIHPFDIAYGTGWYDFWNYYDVDEDINGNLWSIVKLVNGELLGYTEFKNINT